MTAKKRRKKSSSNNVFLNIDEDFNFVIDSYQTSMSPFLSPPMESRARRKIMRKIASRRAPGKVGILDRIEKITNSFEKHEISLSVALNKLANISQRHGDKNLHNGIMSKINMLNGQQTSKKTRPEKNIALFSNLSNTWGKTEKRLSKNINKNIKSKKRIGTKKRKRGK